MKALLRLWRSITAVPMDSPIRLSTRASFDPNELLMARLERAARQQQPNAIEQAWIEGRTKKAKQLAEVIQFHGPR